MAVMRGAVLASFALALVLLPAVASALPMSYVTESVQASYYPNGSQHALSSKGYVEVSVGNTQDVMQYLILNLSKTDDTSLQSRAALRGAAASPNSPVDRTRLFLNTTDRPDDIEYDVNASIVPIIYMEMDYRNVAGGRDLYSGGMNNLTIDINFNSTADLNGLELVFQAATDTNPANYDSMDIYFANATAGSVQISSADGDVFRDHVNWTGNIVKDTMYNIHIESSTIPGYNFDEFYLYVPMGGQCIANRSQPNTFTGITFSDRFSRGPVREGMEMSEGIGGGWDVRGIIRNIASGLEYVVHGWEIYEIGNSTPLASSSSGSLLNSSEILYTSIYNSNKTYFAASFDWEVVWGSSSYNGETIGSIVMPTLYEINTSIDKSVTVQSNSGSGTSLYVRDMVQHLGHSSIGVNNVSVRSTIPSASSDSTQRSWSVSNITVYYANNTGWHDVTSGASITFAGSSPGSDGYVNVDIGNVTALVGRGLGQNEKIYVTYTLSSSAFGSSYYYSFGTASTMVTESGTPITKSYMPSPYTVPGTAPTPVVPPAEEGAGAGAGPPAELPPAYFIDIVKEFADLVFVTPFLVEADTSFVIMDTGTKGVKDVSLSVLVPYDGNLETDRMGLSIYRKATGETEGLVMGSDYMVTDKGLVGTGDEQYREYLITRMPAEGEIYAGGWSLASGDRIMLGYRAKVPFGTHYMLTRVSGYDYYRDMTVVEDAYMMFRRELELKRLEVSEGEFRQEKAVIDRPVTWVKRITVSNPNSLETDDIIESGIFPDTISAYLVTDDGSKETLELESNKETYVSWRASLSANGTRTYFLNVVTPPVLETDRVADILDSNKTLARIMINSTLENFAAENYTDLSFFFEGRNLEVISVEGGEYLLHNDSLEVTFPSIRAGEKRSIIIVYKEIPPILILLLDKAKYQRGQDVEGTMIFVPGESSGGGYLEYEVSGPDRKPEAVYLDIISTPGLSAGNETRVIRKMVTWNKYSGKYTAYAKYRKEFATILFAEEEFEIEPPELEVIPINPLVLVGIALAAVAYLVVRIYRGKTYKEEVGKLRKEIEKL